MNHDHDDLRPVDAPLDALLEERLGNERAPDLIGIVTERHANGDGADIAQLLEDQPEVTTRGNNRPLLTAAMVVLGSLAVVGTVWSAQNETGDDQVTGSRAAQQIDPPQQPEQSGIDLPEADALQKPQDPKKPKAQEGDGKLAVSVKVVDQNGGPVQDFEVEVHYAKGSPPRKIDITTALPRQKRHPRDFQGDFTVIKGLMPGKYVVTVEDDLHAPSESNPFEVVAGDKPPEVVVKMQKGGTIRGSVIDAQGRPVSGAAVRVAAKISNPLEAFVTNRAKQRQATRGTMSDRDGSFEFKRLKPGKYELKVQHADFSTSRTDEIRVENKAKKDIKVALLPGARIVGRVTRTGQPLGKWEVRISKRDTEKFVMLHTAITDDEGRFAFSERIAPGRYKLQAMSGDRNVENPFQVLLQLKESERQFEIRASDRKLEHNIDLK